MKNGPIIYCRKTSHTYKTKTLIPPRGNSSSIYDFGKNFTMIKATELLEAYAKEPRERWHEELTVRDSVDQVATLCTKPTFIRIRPDHFWLCGNDGTQRDYAMQSFILSHAVQILLFAPQERIPNRVYSRDRTCYAHRFPTPGHIGGGTGKKVAGLFSMEDLHRAILLFYFMVKRRRGPKGKVWIGKAVRDVEVQFPGYHDPDTDADPSRAEPPQTGEAGSLEDVDVSSGQDTIVGNNSNSIAPTPEAAVQANDVSTNPETLASISPGIHSSIESNDIGSDTGGNENTVSLMTEANIEDGDVSQNSAADLEDSRSPVDTTDEPQGIDHGVSVAESSEHRSRITGLEAVDTNTAILESLDNLPSERDLEDF